ncbi:hypothetical protein NDU88_007451 [Pleurodeles waltl]|uniref:Uncharacterized protein n=1 Tax=Pleurodeles waltl TaxID=8319 RepID=A0AAV7N3H1_PLEWA|nr:hypothetical protein NDU88_007451 [Pleurodeles waltl]
MSRYAYPCSRTDPRTAHPKCVSPKQAPGPARGLNPGPPLEARPSTPAARLQSPYAPLLLRRPSLRRPRTHSGSPHLSSLQFQPGGQAASPGVRPSTPVARFSPWVHPRSAAI